MRNLKRALSLALASVMLMGMMVVGTSAKGLDDFSDAAEVVNQDAVAVTSEIGIFDGYENGEFKPENVVTRAEMAVIICKMLYGADVKVEQFTETKVFTDVPAWAEGYVNLCASLGIVAGVGDNKFNPNATVTTAEASMMLTKALGYFQSARDFGDSWVLAATAKATELGLYGDLKLTSAAGLTRDNVAEMVFNALTKAVPVQYNELLGVYYNENKGIMYSLTFYYTDTLGYKNFDLVYRSNETTSYGRPGTTWGTGSYRGSSATTEGNDAYGLNEDGSLDPDLVKMLAADEIITVADTPDYVYTATTTQKNVYRDLGKGVADKNTDYGWTYFIDGDEVDGEQPKNVSDDYGFTKTGAETEIYIDSVNEKVTVVVINYYLAEVSKVKSDDDGAYVLLKMPSQYEGAALDTNKFYTEGFAEGDRVVVTVDCADHFAAGKNVDAFVASVAAPETTEGVVTLVNKDNEDNNDSYLKMDDVKHVYSKNTVGDLEEGVQHPALKEEYRLYLDPNGYVLGFQPVTDSTKQYLYVKNAHEALDIQAKVVLADASVETVTVKDDYKNGTAIVSDDDLIGHVFAYTVSDKGVYTLEPIHSDDKDADQGYHEGFGTREDDASDNDGTIENGESYIFGTENNKYLVDLDTIFVDVAAEKAYTGYNEVPNYDKAAFIVAGENRVKDIVFIVEGDKYGNDATYFYIEDYKEFDTVKYDGDYYRFYKSAYVDGEHVSPFYVLRDTAVGAKAVIDADGLYKVQKTIDEDYIISVTAVDDDGEEFLGTDVVTALGNGSFWLTEGEEAENKFTFDNDTKWVFVDEDGEVSVGNKHDIIVEDEDYDEDEDGKTYVTVVKSDDNYAELVYIVTATDDEGNEGDGEGDSDVGEVGNVTIPDGREIANAIENDDSFSELGITDANIAAAVNAMKDLEITVDGNDVTVTGSIAKSDAFNAAWGDTTDRYYLVLTIDAPADFDAETVTLWNNNTSTVVNGSFTLILGLDGTQYLKDMEMTWTDAEGNTVISTVTLDMFGMTYAE